MPCSCGVFCVFRMFILDFSSVASPTWIWKANNQRKDHDAFCSILGGKLLLNGMKNCKKKLYKVLWKWKASDYLMIAHGFWKINTHSQVSHGRRMLFIISREAEILLASLHPLDELYGWCAWINKSAIFENSSWSTKFFSSTYLFYVWMYVLDIFTHAFKHTINLFRLVFIHITYSSKILLCSICSRCKDFVWCCFLSCVSRPIV